MLRNQDMTRRDWMRAAFGGLLGATLLAAPGHAQDRDAVQIEVWAIRATKANNDISPELRSIADDLKKRFNYTGFKLEDRRSGAARTGREFEARLSGGHRCTVEPVGREKQRITANVVVIKEKERKQLARTKVDVRAGAAHLMGGWRFDEKSQDAMVLLIRMR